MISHAAQRSLESFNDPSERAVIIERNRGWERASAETLAAVFHTSQGVIRSILRSAPERQET